MGLQVLNKILRPLLSAQNHSLNADPLLLPVAFAELLAFQGSLSCQNSFNALSQASRPFHSLTKVTFTFALYQGKRNTGLDPSRPMLDPIEISLNKVREMSSPANLLSTTAELLVDLCASG